MYINIFSKRSGDNLYKNNLFCDIKYTKGKLYEDLDTTYKIFSKANKVVNCNQDVYYYFQNNNSIMHKKYDKKRLTGFQSVQNELKYIQKNYKEIENAAIYRLFYECMSILNNMTLFNKDRNIIFNEMKKYRKVVLEDRKISFKQRLLCYSSYFGQIGVKISFWFKSQIKKKL